MKDRNIENFMLKFSQKPIEPEKYLRNLIEFCASQGDIIALYLFGSRAHGIAGPLSDIDIAILLKGGLGKEAYGEKDVFSVGAVAVSWRTAAVGLLLLHLCRDTGQYGVI